jgi:ribosomal protein L37E
MTWAALDQSNADNIKTDTEAAECNDHEWDANSIMRCRDCGKHALAEEFKNEDETCSECGEAYADGGDGYNGKCPSCADAEDEDEEDEDDATA